MIIEQETTQPQQPAPGSAIGRVQLAVIGAVVLLAVGIGAVLGSLLVNGTGASLARAAAYVPENAVMYFEARLDLPGTQRANLRAILDRFPAVNADDILTDALAETLDEALAEGGAPFDYSTDVAPWFDGTVAVAVLDYPMNLDPTQVRLPAVAAFFGTRDASAASTLADELRAEMERAGSSFSSSQHDGVAIWSLDVDGQMAPMSGMGFAYAVTDDQLVMGSGEGAVTTVLDAASDGPTLADAGELAPLMSDLPDERAGTAVVNSEAMLAEMRAQLDASQPQMADALAAYLDAVPPLSVAAVSFEDDAILMDASSGRPDGALAPSNADRALATRVPADAILFADAGNLGAALEQAVASGKMMLAAGPMADDQLAMIDQAEAALGAQLEELVGWIGAGAVAAGWDGEQPYFGLVLEADDPDAAARRLNQLTALVELAAGEDASGIEVGRRTVAGVELTTITYNYGGVPGAGLDIGTAPVLVVEYALDGETALIGFGDAFVETALTLETGDSLAEADRFTSALDRFGGADNAGAFFMDLAALRDAVESALGGDLPAEYQLVRPNLLPFDHYAGVTRVEGDRVVMRSGLVLR